MCGIVGIAGVMPVNQSIYDALTVLQHRGQMPLASSPLMPTTASGCVRLTGW